MDHILWIPWKREMKSMVHYTFINTDVLEYSEVIEDDCVQYYVLFDIETMFVFLETGLTYITLL